MQKLNLTVALVAGLVGGFLSRNLTLPLAHAQNAGQTFLVHSKELQAESFTLVDEKDRPVGTFMIEPNLAAPRNTNSAQDRIVLRDRGGRILWSAGGSAIRPLTEK